MKIKEKYQELGKKHTLPSFEDIDNEFEISTIEKDEFLLREVRRKIVEKLELYATFLEEILNPEANISNMHESKLFNDEERNNLFEIYKKLVYLDRYSIEISVDENDEKTSEFINSVFNEWNEVKETFLRFVKKAKESWSKEVDVKEELGYMG